MKATKTRTLVSVALTVLAAGSILAGIYYVGNKNDMTGSAADSCNVDYDKIGQIVEDKFEKLCQSDSGGSGGSSNSAITGTCRLNLASPVNGGGYGVQNCRAGILARDRDPSDWNKIIRVSQLSRCTISTSQVSGEGCRDLKMNSLDLIIDPSVNKVVPASETYRDLGNGGYAPGDLFMAENVRNTCEKIAKDGYSCWLLNLSTGMAQASCACKKN